MPATTWSTTDKSATVNLTNGNLTATATAASVGVRGKDPKRSGKYYFEFTCNVIANGNTGVGIATFAHSFTLAGANPVTACIVYRSGGFYVDGSIWVNMGAIPTGGVVGFALDLDRCLIWARNGAAGNWNNNAANNPATGVGGAPIAPAMMGAGIDIYPTALFGAINEQVTLNAGATAFTGAVPAGFTSGWDDSVTAATSMVATQVGTEIWQTTVPAVQLTQVGTEIWQTSIPALQLTQIGTEIWVPNNAFTQAQTTQLVLEMWSPGGTTTPLALVTQVLMEMWAPSGMTTPIALSTQIVLEMWASVVEALPVTDMPQARAWIMV